MVERLPVLKRQYVGSAVRNMVILLSMPAKEATYFKKQFVRNVIKNTVIC